MEAAEALCESLAIVDRGRVVASGTLRELKRSSRARTIRLGIDGETLPPWMASLPGVLGARPGAGFAELELGAETDPSSIVAAAVANGARVTRFEVADPSLETIFIELVGRSPDDDAAPPEDATSPGLSVIEGAA